MKISLPRRIVILTAGLAAVAVSALPSTARADSFKLVLTGAQQVPPVQTEGSGTASLAYDPAIRLLTWSIAYSGLSGPVTMAHFHGPASAEANAPVVIWLARHGGAAESPINGQATLTPEQAQQVTAGEWYINLHTQAHPAGEVRAQLLPPKN